MSESCICLDYDNGPDVWSDPIRTARKAHKCCECGAEISPGEKYEDYNGCYEGSWSNYKTCWLCLAIRRDFFKCGWRFTGLREDFREAHGWDYIDGPTPEDWAEDHDALFSEATDA